MSRIIKILVCEGDPMLLKIMEARLKRDKYEIITAQNGKEAEELIKNTGDITLIVTNVLLPYKSGLEIIRMVRVELMEMTPIIAISKVGEEDTIMQTFKMGADDFVTIPLNPEELSMRIKKMLIRSL